MPPLFFGRCCPYCGACPYRFRGIKPLQRPVIPAVNAVCLILTLHVTLKEGVAVTVRGADATAHLATALTTLEVSQCS